MVVLFDVDRTLVSVNCTAALARALAADGIVSHTAVATVALDQLLYRLKCRSFPALMASAYGLLLGCDISRVEACARRVVTDVVAPTIHPEALARLASHKARGDRVVLASAAPAVVIERLGTLVGVGEVIATDFERIGSRFGKAMTPQGYGKGKVELAARAGLFESGRPHVYTDHAEDWPLISASGFATLVNPAARLIRDARRHGISHEVVHWRRDRVSPTASPLEPRTPGP